MKSSTCSSDLLFGDPKRFGLQSGMFEVYPGHGQMGLGFFVIHILGHSYGIARPDATLLACSFEAVRDRLSARGSHLAPFSNENDGVKIAQRFYDINYGIAPITNSVFGVSASEFEATLDKNRIVWAPDGDEAFDDGSYVLQFDSESSVRLLGFRVDDVGTVDESSFSDCWVGAQEYYSVLEAWSSAFMSNWLSLKNEHTRQQMGKGKCDKKTEKGVV